MICSDARCLPDELNRLMLLFWIRPARVLRIRSPNLATATVPRIAYVSCNPVTFARDAFQLTQAGYVLDWVQPVDQFRWSSHIELAAAFRRA